MSAVEARFLCRFPPPMRPMDRNWFSSVSARSNAMRGSKCAPEPNSIFSCPFLHPVRDRHKGRNPEIAGDVEHPKPASGFGKLGLQIADVGIVELVEIHFRPLQSIVPPDGVGIPFDQLEEPLDDGFLERVAGRAAVGIRVIERPGPR